MYNRTFKTIFSQDSTGYPWSCFSPSVNVIRGEIGKYSNFPLTKLLFVYHYLLSNIKLGVDAYLDKYAYKLVQFHQMFFARDIKEPTDLRDNIQCVFLHFRNTNFLIRNWHGESPISKYLFDFLIKDFLSSLSNMTLVYLLIFPVTIQVSSPILPLI